MLEILFYCPDQSVYPVCFPEHSNEKYMSVGMTFVLCDREVPYFSDYKTHFFPRKM